ncbi:hypothetical protein M422DRAFT_274078 [Sphaerobolus stellatus SS14]|uniref:Uncharacterized protein n=1 Tax=Sphaerobolus stellatus (strain SS14) TaxID=990650 RepID=A0A0C9U7I2_SPHS4|nr:hypothetical protein M422DRAFT_274078 [Sphaerobolus stellatus SS14]
MSTCCSCKWAEELSAPVVGEDESLQGFTAGELTDPPPTSVDPQQSSEVFAKEHLGDQNTRAHSPQTVPAWIQSPIGMAGAAGTCAPSQCLLNNLSVAQIIQEIPESTEHSWCSIGETQSIDMNALREEIKETFSATIKDKLCSNADSVTTIPQSMIALETNTQYWSDLSNKAACHSCRALELQLKMAEEKVNTLLYEEAPEEVLLEAAREACNIHFQLDQNTHLHEAGLMPEQQVRFRTDTGENINNISREYGVNLIHEAHIDRPEADAPLPQQSTPSLLMTAQLDGAVVNRMAEYSGIQQIEAKPEKSFLAKAGVKMGNPPTYSGECNLEKFKSWVASVLRFMSMYNLLGPGVGKVQLQFLGQCLTDEAQEWFY